MLHIYRLRIPLTELWLSACDSLVFEVSKLDASSKLDATNLRYGLAQHRIDVRQPNLLSALQMSTLVVWALLQCQEHVRKKCIVIK